MPLSATPRSPSLASAQVEILERQGKLSHRNELSDFVHPQLSAFCKYYDVEVDDKCH